MKHPAFPRKVIAFRFRGESGWYYSLDPVAGEPVIVVLTHENRVLPGKDTAYELVNRDSGEPRDLQTEIENGRARVVSGIPPELLRAMYQSHVRNDVWSNLIKSLVM